MSKIAVNEITNEAGTGGPTLPNGIAGGLTLGGDLTLDTNGIYLGGTGSANYLDDYEEGTFTPDINLGISSPGYTEQKGNYVKIGRCVYVHLQVILDGSGSSTTNDFRIGGLPFTTVPTTSTENGNFSLMFSGFNFSGITANMYIYGNTRFNETNLAFYHLTSTSADDIKGNEIGTSATVIVTGFYYTNA